MLHAEIGAQFARLLEDLPPGRSGSQLREQIPAARREIRAFVLGGEQAANRRGLERLVLGELRRIDRQRRTNRRLDRRAALIFIPADVDKPGLQLVWRNVDADLPHHSTRSGPGFVGLPFSSRYWTLPCGPSRSS